MHPQAVVRECAATLLRPIIRLLLSCGMSCTEFISVVRSLFVEVATEDFSIRGRPANASRVAAITGLPRKSISKIRALPKTGGWSPDHEASPINTVIHYWKYDPKYSDGMGQAFALSVAELEQLISEYGGDIPHVAIRQELFRYGIVEQDVSGEIRLVRDFAFPLALNEDFLRNYAFSMKNLGETILHNSRLVRRQSVTEVLHENVGRFERFAWSHRLDFEATEKLQAWARSEGEKFLQRADALIAELETKSSREDGVKQNSGIGLYYFSDD